MYILNFVKLFWEIKILHKHTLKAAYRNVEIIYFSLFIFFIRKIITNVLFLSECRFIDSAYKFKNGGK